MRELTKAEEEIMQILWRLKKGLVKDILDQMPEPKPAYNTVSTVVRILEKKGFIGHKAYGKTHEYFPLIARDKYRKFYLNNLITGHFNGSFKNLVSFFAKENSVNMKEMEEILKELSDNPKQQEDE